jgi:hypothetical protein
MTLDDVVVPDQDISDPIETPDDSLFYAKSHGVFNVFGGVHFFIGEAASSGTEFSDSGFVNNVQFEMKSTGGKKGLFFPVDSASYKGSLQVQHAGSDEIQTVVDKQIALKFRLNTGGFYNVYGKGINESYGTFDLVGTFRLDEPNIGYLNLFRTYSSGSGSTASCMDSRRIARPVSHNTSTISIDGRVNSKRSHCSISTHDDVPVTGASPQRKSPRRKVKSLCDPETILMTIMEACNKILQKLFKKDQSTGSFFAIPVDPIALNIPLYPNIITNPMDLGTIQSKMDSKELTSPYEFSRAIRLVFENAITFNTSTTHEAHKIARVLLKFFDKEFQRVERLLQQVGLVNASKWNELYSTTLMRRKQEEDFNQFKKNLVVPALPSPSCDSCWPSFIETWVDDTEPIYPEDIDTDLRHWR